MTAAPPVRTGGTVVGSYELLERIGTGGMGEVWKARDRVLDRLVALKFLSSQGSARYDLLHEARAASSLNHPNIVTVFQIGESHGDSYLAMEFVEGESLRRRIGGAHDIAESFDISEQIVDGLASAHARGIIHRDLKPDNIMIRADGCVKLVDFGLAKRLRLDDGATSATMAGVASQSGELIGTVSYMSPEQARGHDISTSSDVFSLGIVIYELFSGRHPFKRDEVLDTLNAIVREPPPPLPDTPGQVGQIVSRALQKEPSRRYSSAVEISEPLKQARREWDSDTTRHVPAIAAAPVSRIGRALAALLLGALILGGGWTVLRPAASADAAVPAVRSLAVMPFRTTDATAVLLTEALPEDLGGELSKSGFQVAGRSSVLQSSATRDARLAASELGVDRVLDGTVRLQATTLLLAAILQLWLATPYLLIAVAQPGVMRAFGYQNRLDDLNPPLPLIISVVVMLWLANVLVLKARSRQ